MPEEAGILEYFEKLLLTFTDAHIENKSTGSIIAMYRGSIPNIKTPY
jgi:hypothetical protein